MPRRHTRTPVINNRPGAVGLWLSSTRVGLLPAGSVIVTARGSSCCCCCCCDGSASRSPAPATTQLMPSADCCCCCCCNRLADCGVLLPCGGSTCVCSCSCSSLRGVAHGFTSVTSTQPSSPHTWPAGMRADGKMSRQKGGHEGRQ